MVEYVWAWTPTKARWKTSGRRAENIVVREKDDGVEETQGFKLSSFLGEAPSIIRVSCPDKPDQ